MTKLSDKLLFSDYPTGTIIPIGEDEPCDPLISQAFTSPSGLPKQEFYNGDGWRRVSEESSQTHGEISITNLRGNELRAFLTRATCVLEYGAGIGPKTSAILKQCPNVTKYRNIDSSKELMEEQLPALAHNNPSVECVGLLGPFDKAQPLLEKNPAENVCILSLGSTLSNTSPENITNILRRTGQIGSILLVGQCGDTNVSSVMKSYSTPAFIRFIRGGLKKELASDDWEHELRILHGPFRVQRTITAKTRIGNHEKGACLVVFEAYKYSKEEFTSLIKAIPGFKVEVFSAPDTKSYLYAITPPRNHASPI